MSLSAFLPYTQTVVCRSLSAKEPLLIGLFFTDVCVCCVSGASDETVCMPAVHTDCCLQVSFRKRDTNHRALSAKEPLITGLFCGYRTR